MLYSISRCYIAPSNLPDGRKGKTGLLLAEVAMSAYSRYMKNVPNLTWKLMLAICALSVPHGEVIL